MTTLPIRSTAGNSESLLIGLDFGTTFSGIAYALGKEPEKVISIVDWPGRRGSTLQKCPTLIRYNTDGSISWGYELERGKPGVLDGFKLLLDIDQEKPKYVPDVDTQGELKKLGKPAVEVTADYMRLILQHALSKMRGSYGERFIDVLEKQFIVSVPAVWSDKAKQATLHAARKAGLSPVRLVKEPEAAALYTLHTMTDKGLDVGDAFVLCDAGGGTVDLISYEITSVSPLELKELTESTGGLAGSLMIDRRFDTWLSTVLGEDNYKGLQGHRHLIRARNDFNETFKPRFRSLEDDDIEIWMPKAGLKDIKAKEIDGDSLILTAQALHDIFEPVMNAIKSLVARQSMMVRMKRMRAHHEKDIEIKAIFLVGGFGSSHYLFDSIQESHKHFKNHKNEDLYIPVIQPNDAWAAIVRGAVMTQVPSQAKVISNVAPKHYGVAALHTFDPVADIGEEKIWDKDEEEWKVRRMQWYIKKGDDLLRSRQIAFPFYRTFKPHPSYADLQIKTTLQECSLDKQPRHPEKNTVTKNCTLHTDLSVVPSHVYDNRFRKDGTEYWALNYKILVDIQSGPMIFGIEVDGKEYGSVETSF